jgi:hypothetical protein
MAQLKATIQIGGKLDIALVPKFCEVIPQDMVSLAWDTTLFTPSIAEDLLGACTVDFVNGNVKSLQLFTMDATIGGFPLIEIFALQHKLDYTLKSAGDVNYGPYIVEYRGYCDFYYKHMTNSRFHHVFPNNILKAVDKCEHAQEIKYILQDALIEIPTMTNFSINSPQTTKIE